MHWARSPRRRWRDPGDDLISVWVRAEIDGVPYTPEHIANEVGLFIAGGAETTRTAIAHGLRAFVDHPEQWEALAADPSLVPGAVEEVLRWVAPLNNMFRRTLSDDVVGGQKINAGDRLVLLYPAANRDESVFDDPFAFDIRRSPNPHVSFGFGTHLCIGTHVARAALTEVFGQMSARVSATSVWWRNSTSRRTSSPAPRSRSRSATPFEVRDVRHLIAGYRLPAWGRSTRWQASSARTEPVVPTIPR